MAVIIQPTMKMDTRVQTSTLRTLSICSRLIGAGAVPSTWKASRAGSFTHSQIARAQNRPGTAER